MIFAILTVIGLVFGLTGLLNLFRSITNVGRLRKSFMMLFIAALSYMIYMTITGMLAVAGIPTTHNYWISVQALYIIAGATWSLSMYAFYKTIERVQE